MSEIEPFLIGLILVGLGLTAKVARDGLRQITDVKLRIIDCKALTANYEVKIVDIEKEVREAEEQVQTLRKTVQGLEAKKRELAPTIKAKKAAEEKKSRTGFKVDLG